MTSANSSAALSTDLVSTSSSSMSAGVSMSGPVNFGHLITARLSPDTYMFWRAQLVSLLRSNLLFGYVDGTFKCPPSTLPHRPKEAKADDPPLMLDNPAYRAWHQQDQAILSAILSSLTIEVSGMVMFAASSQDAWTTLESSFTSQSTARSAQIRSLLQTTKKLNSSATVFFNKIKSLSDTLTSIGQPLRPEEFQGFILDGLDEEYDALVEMVLGRDHLMPVRDLFARLLATEQRVENRRSQDLGSGSHSANVARMGRPLRSGALSSPPPSSVAPPSRSTYVAPPSAGGGGSGGGRGNGNRPVCQLCGEVGHIASTCFKRFQKTFLGVGNDGRYTARQLSMANHVSSGRTQHQTVDPAWYMDTGTTEHLTSDVNQLHMKESYHGKEKIFTANGSGMHISHIGQAILSTRTSRPLHLRDILHVPTVTKSLLSVPRFTRDNLVFVEFHPKLFFVKDLATKEVLLRGRYHDGLYRLDAPPIKQVFTALRASSAQWHARLGHPASQVVQHILRSNELPSIPNKLDVVCDACQQGKSYQLPFSLSNHVTHAPLELIYSDVWGPAQTSVSGHNFYVSFVDAYSRFTWLYLLKRKSDVFDVFLKFQAHVERLLSHKILRVQTDWGGEYIKLNVFFDKLGILHRVSCPHTHQQNGTVECKHRHIVETGLTLLAHASVPFP